MARKKYVIFARALDRRGRVISTGENNYNKTHPLMQHFAEKVGLDEKIYLHAEVLALIRAGEAKVHTLVVARYNSDGSPALAKPCPVCQAAIKAWGVKEIIYTTDVVKETV
jgi:deoxycytidylate deaminase